MSAPEPRRRRAAVAPDALAAVRARAGESIEVVALEEGLALDGFGALVPTGDPWILERLAGLEHLDLVQVVSAGTDWIENRLPPQVTLCNARGARDAPVAEWVLGALLGGSTQLLRYAGATSWQRSHELEDLGDWTVIIVGMGSIGRRLATYLEPLGTRVVGVGSRARAGVHGPEELPELFLGADAVVVLAPLTDATRGLIGARELAMLRDGALVVNAGRGPVIDAGSLVAELASGRLRAVLDVTDPEPLPDGHALWSAPGLIGFTPHIAGDSPLGNRRAAEFAGDQLGRWARGEPLENVVRERRAP